MNSHPAPAGLLLSIDGSIGTITLNRPEKLNAMKRGFYRDLRQVLDDIVADKAVRAVIITGAGDRAFSAGGDIGSLAELGDLVDRRAYQIDAMRAFLAVERLPVPTIAAVNGYALGGGCELALACDIVLAAESAKFGMPEAALGLVPGYGVLRAADRIGRSWTKYLVATARQIDAATALKIGLAQELHAVGKLMPAARELAAEIIRNSPLALEVGKRIIDRDLPAADFDYSVEALALLQAAPDALEGTQAFLGRRAPSFRNRR